MEETFSKKRLELFVETPYLNLLLDELERLEVPGYTVLPALAGSGRNGPWRRDGRVSSAGLMVSVVCILDEELLEEVLGHIRLILDRQIAVVSISDVVVLRAEHF